MYEVGDRIVYSKEGRSLFGEIGTVTDKLYLGRVEYDPYLKIDWDNDPEAARFISATSHVNVSLYNREPDWRL